MSNAKERFNSMFFLIIDTFLNTSAPISYRYEEEAEMVVMTRTGIIIAIDSVFRMRIQTEPTIFKSFQSNVATNEEMEEYQKKMGDVVELMETSMWERLISAVFQDADVDINEQKERGAYQKFVLCLIGVQENAVSISYNRKTKQYEWMSSWFCSERIDIVLSEAKADIVYDVLMSNAQQQVEKQQQIVEKLKLFLALETANIQKQ